MYIIISNKENDKYCIISNKYREVIIEAFHLFSEKNKDTITNHLYPFIEFLRYLKESNLEINITNRITTIPIERIEVMFLQDISFEDIKLIKYLNNKSISPYKIISVAEHPVYQIKNFTEYIKEFDVILCPYKLQIEYEETSFGYIFKSLPFLEKENKKEKIIDVSMICSNLSTKSNSNYSFRRHMINVISSIDKIDFEWYGRGWQHKGIINNKKDLKYRLNSILGNPKINSNSYNKYKGEIKDKYCLMNSKTSLAIENHSWPTGYITEKLLEPLIYGSIPLYIGTPMIHQLGDSYNKIDKIIINEPNASKIIESIMHFKEIPINECKRISKKLREEINRIVFESRKETNLMKSAKIIIDKLTL